jgi:hypothetical protein
MGCEEKYIPFGIVDEDSGQRIVVEDVLAFFFPGGIEMSSRNSLIGKAIDIRSQIQPPASNAVPSKRKLG